MADEYSSLLEEYEQQRQQRERVKLNGAATLTMGTDPDAAARATNAASYLGIPPQAALAAPAETERAARLKKLDSDTAAAPVLRQKYTDADFARLAHDDSGVLAGVEGVVGKLGRAAVDVGKYAVSAPGALGGGFLGDVGKFGKALAASAPGLGGGLYGAAAAPVELLGLDTIGGFLREESTRAKGVSERVADIDPNASFGEKALLSGVQSAGQNLLTMPFGLASSGSKAMLGIMGLITGGQSYTEAREKGLSPVRAVPHAVAQATAEIVTERYFGAHGFLENVKAGASAGKLFMFELTKELPGEMGATLWQNFNDWMNLNPEKSVGQFVHEQPEAMAQTIIATLAGGTTQIGAVKAMQGAVGTLAGQQQQAQRAQVVAQDVEQFTQLMEASRLRGRHSQTFVDMVNEMAAERGGETPSELYVDAQQLANTLNQSAITIDELRAVAPEMARQLENPAPGSDVRAPLGELAGLGPQLTAALVEHVRETPGAMSRAEATEFLASEPVQQMRAQFDQTLTTHEEQQTFRQQVAQVSTAYEQQLNATGRFSPEVNKAQAQILGNYYAVQALRAGIPLDQFLQKYRLNVAAQTPVAGQQGQMVSQQQMQAHVATPEFKAWFGDSKVVDEQGAPRVMYHGTASNVTEFRPKQAGAIFLTDNPEFAGTFANMSERWKAQNEGTQGGQNIMPLVVSAQKPFDYENPANVTEVVDEMVRSTKRPPWAPRTPEGDAAFRNWWTGVLPGGNWATIESDEVQAAIKAAGFDAFYVTEGDQKNLAVYDPTQIKSATGNRGTFDPADPSILHQGPDVTAPRGTLSFSADITASPTVMALLENADRSSFFHEGAHFFLEVQSDLAARIQGQIAAGAQVSDSERGIVDDMNRILEWFGVEGDSQTSALDRWLGMTLAEKEASHEMWARGFEKFIGEGKAPSLDLQPLFARFRAWLVDVYKTLVNLNVKLTDDVRMVMSRMIASDAAIAEAQAARAMGPLFRTAESAGMTGEEYIAYQRLAENATAAASAELDSRLLADMKWLSKARDKALKAAQATADAQRKEVRREVSAEVMARPVYQAWQILTGKGDLALPGVPGTEMAGASLRLRSSKVKEIDPAAYEILAKRRMTSEDRGWHPDIAAENIPGGAFVSGEQLVREVAAAPPPSQVIDALTDQRMLERYGDITSPAALARAADEAVHNELRARVIASELKALNKANRLRESGDSLVKTRDTVDVMARAAREYARDIIARQQIRNLRPEQYAAAEARSAKLAEKAMGADTAEAAMHKRNQLVNNYATKAAYEAQAEITKATEFFRRVLRGKKDDVSKTRDWDLVQAARAILAAYDIGSKGEAAQTYLETMQRNDPVAYQVLKDHVDDLTANARPVREMTVEEFRNLAEAVRELWYKAKRDRQIEVDGQLVPIETAKLALSQRLDDIGVPDRVPGEGEAVTDAERRLGRLRTFVASGRRVEGWVTVKDGGYAGPFRKYIWNPIKEAAERYRADNARYLTKYQALLANLVLTEQRIEAPELGYVFGAGRGGLGKAELLHAMLHTGNESNLRKLLLGGIFRSKDRSVPWAMQRPDGTLDTSKWDGFVKRMIDTGVLTKQDFDFLQGVWDLLEETKPLAQKTHREVFGRYFDEVTANAFTNQFGTYRGGYVPAMTDPEIVKDAATRKLVEDQNQTLSNAFPSTGKGFTKTRVEYNQPLLLDLRILSSHINKVLMFSHMEQPVREVRKILASQEVSVPLHRMDAATFDTMLTPWLNRAARQQVETPIPGDNGLMRGFSILTQRAGMAAMFANVSNTVQQITGFSLAALRVSPLNQLRATVDYVKAPRQFARAVADNSTYMAMRMENEVHAMNNAIDDILLNPSTYKSAQAWTAKHAYFMQSAFDNVMGPILWTAAYNEALEKHGMDDREAKRFADSTIRQTQGSSLPEDISAIESGNALVRSLMQFAGYFNMQANLVGTEFAVTMNEVGLRKGMGRGLYIFIMGFYIPAVVAELIAVGFRGGPGDDDKDGMVLDDWLSQVLLLAPLKTALAMVPGVGKVGNMLINMLNSNPSDDRMSISPAVSMIESAAHAGVDVYKAVKNDGSRRNAVRDLATLTSLTTGLPATAVARPLGYIAGVEQGKVKPTGPVDATRGMVTGTPSPESRR